MQAPRDNLTIRSPNGRIAVEAVLGRGGTLGLEVRVEGVTLLRTPNLGLDLLDGGKLESGLRLVGSRREAVADDYALVCGKTRRVQASGRQLTLDLAEAAASRRRLRVVVRAYDDGAAFRYELPAGADHAIRAARARVVVPQEYVCWGADLGAFDTSHETEFRPVKASHMEPHSLFDLPLVCTTGHGVAFALAEAGLENYPALYLARIEDEHLGVAASLPPHPGGDPDVAVQWPADGGPHASPWRVVMVADSPGGLIEANLVTTLAAPSRIADPSWVQPGKAAWDWWSMETPADPAGPRMGTAHMRRLIDFAANTKLQYLLIDADWYANADRKTAGPDVDVTRSIPEIDLPALVEYGRQRGIGLFVWLNWAHLDAQIDAALAWYERIGLRGIKVDFMNRDDQDMIAFYHRVLAKAAAHRLMVDLHGATHPAGLERTYPNFITQEGVMGAEYNKWTTRVTSRHNVALAYTRLLLGPMDYTPGGFRNVTPAQFAPREVLPLVQTTRGQALAMYVVFLSPFACISDSPATYDGAAGVDFLSEVPTTWDETRFLAGEIGAFIVLARRSGSVWFVGAMTDGEARTVSVPLAFLAPGPALATVYADGDKPSALVIERDRPVEHGGAVALRLAADGGGVVVVRPD